MANPQKSKGDTFERFVCAYLAQRMDCERIPAGTAEDRGDLWTRLCAIQVKNRRNWELGVWLRETLEQQQNAGKVLHALILKRPRHTAPQDQIVLMTLGQFRELLAFANHYMDKIDFMTERQYRDLYHADSQQAAAATHPTEPA